MRHQRLREGCGLPEPRAASFVRLPLQLIDLVAQSIIDPLQAIMLTLRLIALALGAFRPFSPVLTLARRPIGWSRRVAAGHASVMPESRPKYKGTLPAR